VASRAIGRGLAQVEPASPNTLIAYSAKAGSTALDGDTNSPFTIALSKHLTTPGLDVRRAFGFVRDDVLKDTANRQEPFVYGSLGGDDVPLVPAPAAAPPAPAPSAQSEARRDYELALQVGNKDALNAFVAQYPDGFYANLARIQLAKIAAEEARIAATEKARLAEQQRARLAAEGTQTAQQLLAAEADAKAAEQARVAAEKAKQVALEQAADAERTRATAETSTAVAAPLPAEKVQNTNVAALTPGPPPQADLAKSVQIELRRVGCLTGAADGEWNAASQRSLTLFNRNAGTRLDVKTASLDTLDAIKQKSSRVCPLVCEHGFKAEGERCGKIVCAEGSFLNDDNECEKRRGKTPTAARERNDRRERVNRADRYDRDVPERLAPEFSAPRPRASQRASGSGGGQIVCGISGCAPVSRGCHVEFKTTAQGGPVEGGGGNVQVCN
jgi:hypothetical protein